MLELWSVCVVCWRCLLLTRWHMTFTAFWFYHPIANCHSQQYDEWASVCTVHTCIMVISLHRKKFSFFMSNAMSRPLVSIVHINRAVELIKMSEYFFSFPLKIDQVWECVLISWCDQSINFHRKTFTELHRICNDRRTCRISHRTWIFNIDQDKNRTEQPICSQNGYIARYDDVRKREMNWLITERKKRS